MFRKDLVIFVEGPDDETFFKKIVLPLLKTEYRCKVEKYAEEKPKEIRATLQGYVHAGFDYIFVSDHDKAKSTEARKDEVCVKYPSVEKHRVVIVKKVIEGWYLAGLSDSRCIGLRKQCDDTSFCGDPTDDLTKSQFKTIGKKCQFNTEKLFKLEILKYYSVHKAKGKNRSFNEFCACYTRPA
jgi:hypothetical protein